MKEEFSVLLGYISIIFWLFAQFPQLIENARQGNSDSLSLLFLANWLTGDFANLIGCLLTNQLPFQTYLAMYFVFIDTSLFVQSLFFRLKASNNIQKTEEEEDDDDETPLLQSLSRINSNQSLSSMLAQGLLIGLTNSTDSLHNSTVELLVEPPPLIDSSYQLGRMFAWVCCFLYLSSRLPQIYRNFERKSCNGLAMTMFGCALMGNVTYSASILIKSFDPLYLYNALPYLLGSGGTVVFDIVILFQYIAYKNL